MTNAFCCCPLAATPSPVWGPFSASSGPQQLLQTLQPQRGPPQQQQLLLHLLQQLLECHLKCSKTKLQLLSRQFGELQLEAENTEVANYLFVFINSILDMHMLEHIP